MTEIIFGAHLSKYWSFNFACNTINDQRFVYSVRPTNPYGMNIYYTHAEVAVTGSKYEIKRQKRDNKIIIIGFPCFIRFFINFFLLYFASPVSTKRAKMRTESPHKIDQEEINEIVETLNYIYQQPVIGTVHTSLIWMRSRNSLKKSEVWWRPEDKKQKKIRC